MTATTQAEQTALTLPQRAAVALGTAEHEIKLHELAQASCRILAIANADGREEAHRAAMNLRNARVAIANTGKAAREDAQAFAKAVIAEEKRLVSIIEPEETRVLGLRDEWDARIAAEKAAKIAAERARVEAIDARIQRIRNTPLGVAGKPSGVIREARDAVRDLVISEELYGEQAFRDKAMGARSEALNALEAAFEAALAAEAAARAAEEARKAEAARIEAERAELGRLRAEQAERERLAKIEADRIAAEQAAEAKRLAALAAAQEAELRRQREAEAARIRAEQEARDREATEQRRQLAEEQAALAEQQAAFARAQDEARQRAEAAARLESDHGEALAMNAQFDAKQEAERARLQALADQAAADARERADDERKAGLPAGSLSPESLTVRDEFIDSAADPLTDAEIIETVATTFSLTDAEAVERLARIDFVAARERLAA